MRTFTSVLKIILNNVTPALLSSIQIGMVLLLAGIAALNRVRMEIPLEKENQVKLVKFMIRIAMFSALYLVPLLAVLSCYLYENSYRAVWETTWVQEKCREYHIPCPYKVKHLSDSEFIKPQNQLSASGFKDVLSPYWSDLVGPAVHTGNMTCRTVTAA